MNQHRQLLLKLPARQQTLDFGRPGVWQQLSAAQRCDCQTAIAELICQVAQPAPSNNEHENHKDNEHE